MESAGIAALGTGNFNYARGSISFWVCPAWMPDGPAASASRSLLAADNFGLNYQPSRHTLFFMTGTANKQDGYRWDYGTANANQVAAWKAGDWHHVAITWDISAGDGAHKASIWMANPSVPIPLP